MNQPIVTQLDKTTNIKPYAVMVAFGICLIVGSVLLLNSSNSPVKVGGLDPIFYFANSHALLFRHTFDVRPELKVIPIPPYNAIYPGYKGANGMPGSPWAVGYSMLAVPFLGVGTLLDAALGSPPNGYGDLAMLWFLSANSVFTVIGLYCTMKFLVRSGTGPWAACLISIAMWFSTTLVYYSLAPLSHAATFAATSAFLLTWSYVNDSLRAAAWVGFGFIGGLMSICRWQDVAFILGVLLFDLTARTFSIRRWLLFAPGFAVFWIPQIIQWKIVYGKYLTMPYGPGFTQLPPRHILDVLFSSNHGWFVWTPIVAFGIAGLLVEFRRYWPWLVTILFELCVVGALVVWWQSEAFGARMLTSTVPLIALGISVLFRKASRIGKFALGAGLAACALYTTLFAIQYSFRTIPRETTLDADQLFWDKLELLEDPVTYLEVASHRPSLLPD